MKKILLILLGLFIGSRLDAYSQFIDFEDGLVAYFPFNATAEDKSGSGNDGIVKGATLTTDRYGNEKAAYNFDGKSGSILIPFNANLDFSQKESYSVSLWVKPRDLNSGCLLFKNYDYGLKWEGMKKPVTLYNGAANGFMNSKSLSWRTDQWYNLVMVRTATEITYFVNGKLDYKVQAKKKANAKQEPIYIGKHPYYWGGFEGAIDDICIFNRALTLEEIEALVQIERMPLSVTPRNNAAKIPGKMITGVWHGIFSQPDNLQADNYAYWINFQVTGDQVKGYSRIEIPNSESFGILRIEGTLKETSLTFNEISVLREKNPTGLDWCKKFAKLRYDPTKESLEGSWYADNCKNNGDILVFKSDASFNFYDKPSAVRVSLSDLASRMVAQKTSNVSNSSTKEKVSVTLDIDPITFLVASANLTQASKNYLLNNLVPALKANPEVKLRIVGHTDGAGDASLNLQLSKDRARSVLNYLATNGISRNRLESEGYGESNPIAPNNTAEGRKKNRRVEIELIED